MPFLRNFSLIDQIAFQKPFSGQRSLMIFSHLSIFDTGKRLERIKICKSKDAPSKAGEIVQELLNSRTFLILFSMLRNPFKLPAFAKINWFLRVLGKRDDGFHELCTVFQTVSLCDYLSFSESDELQLSCNLPDLPTDENNLILKAAERLQKHFGQKKGARIHLEKRIPSPGGLGGGSADAAVALLGLARLWNRRISRHDLCQIGQELGADVPFFFYGGTAAATGRGTEIHPIDELEEKFMLLVTPPVSVSTAAAYGKLNAPRLTNPDSKSILKICFDEAETLKSRQSELKNDFEKTIFGIAPEIERVKETLLTLGAERALMSGSGASVFAIFENEETRQATIKALEGEQTWRQFAVATISREKYRDALRGVWSVVSD